MQQARSLHTLTAFHADERDNVTGALVAGGGTGTIVVPIALNSTEVYDPLNRVFTPGPMMSVERARHTAVRLADGKVVICGGMTNAASGTGGPATATCELYDPATNSFLPFPSMLQPRLAHELTLLADGRLLASGGFADWTDAGTNFAARLNTALDSTEIWDPVTNAWTAGPTMNAKRAGHTQTLLNDGRVLIVAGCRGGTPITVPGGTSDVPLFTTTCQLFDPVTNTLGPSSFLLLAQARGFHAASRLPNGTVLITGGAAPTGISGVAQADASCLVFDPLTNAFSTTGSLAAAVAFHTQVAHPTNGNAIVIGGAIGDFAQQTGLEQTAEHDGTTAAGLADIGTHPVLSQVLLASNSHASAVLHDGTILTTGGYQTQLLGAGETARCLLYVP